MKKTIVIVIALLILCAGGILATAQGPPQSWTWTVTVADTNTRTVNLVGDGKEGNSYYTDYAKDGAYLVYVGVSKLTKSAYRFRLHIWNGSDRYISVPGVGSFKDVYLNPDLGPGYFPVVEDSCDLPPELPDCQADATCSERLTKFLALPHPVCNYQSVLLQITVPLDIERLRDGKEVGVNGDVRLTIVNTYDSLQWPDQAFHNMDALTLPTGTAPLRITRKGPNSWGIRVASENLYMNYGEFYFGFWHNRPGDNKISMLADGMFNFDTTWTRQ